MHVARRAPEGLPSASRAGESAAQAFVRRVDHFGAGTPGSEPAEPTTPTRDLDTGVRTATTGGSYEPTSPSSAASAAEVRFGVMDTER